MKCKILINDEVNCTITGLSPSHNSELVKQFAIKLEGSRFMPLVQMGQWDGKINYFKETGKTFVRLLDEIVPYLSKWKYEIELVDKRIPIKHPADRITSDYFSHIKGYGNKPIEIRPYQFESMNKCLDAGSGFVIAGTGSGKCFSGDTSINLKVNRKLSTIINKIQIAPSNNESTNITCTFEELFDAIKLIENTDYTTNEFYKHSQDISVTGISDGEYVNVTGLIQKIAIIYHVTFSDGSVLRCADTHSFIDHEWNEVHICDLSTGDFVRCVDNNMSSITSIVNTGEFEKVYDISVDSAAHLFSTPNGVLHHNTLMCGALCDVYNKNDYKCIVIVPSSDLVNQTYDTFSMLEMDVGRYSGEHKDVNHKSVIATWQSLQNNPSVMRLFQAVIVDECHGAKANVIQKLINKYGNHIAFRFGVTGTFPKPLNDQYALKSSIGQILDTITAKWLMDNGYLATLDIELIETCEPKERLPDYNAEKAWLSKSQNRMEALASEIIKQRDIFGNTLVLVSDIKFGKRLIKLIPGAVFMAGETDTETRKKNYAEYKDVDDKILVCSIGIAKQGISINEIYTMFLIDIGKSFITAIQSIGRGLRLAEGKTKVRIFDVSANMKYSKRHRSDRVKYYKEAAYPMSKVKKLNY